MRTIVFDVDDTLYDQQQPFRNAMTKIFPNVATEDMHELYLRFRHHSDETFPKVLASHTELRMAVNDCRNKGNNRRIKFPANLFDMLQQRSDIQLNRLVNRALSKALKDFKMFFPCPTR